MTYGTKTRTTFFIALAVLTALLVGYTFTYAMAFSAFAAAGAKAALALLVFWVTDTYLVTEIDTIKEIQNGNIAYGLLLVALALIVAGTIATG